jgi:hypothetical protein
MLTVDQSFVDAFVKHAGLDLTVGGVGGDLLRRCTSDAINKPEKPIFLPAPKDSGTVWYVMPRSPQQARILRDHVKASLSFPYSDYDGTRGKFSLDNP